MRTFVFMYIFGLHKANFSNPSIVLKVAFICSVPISIYGIYIAPLQGNYSEALPAQARAKRKVLRRL